MILTNFLQGLNPSTLLVLLPLLAGCWTWIFQRWQRGLYALVFYVPVAGAVSLKLYPALWPKELADIFLIAPAYLGFVCHPENWRFREIHIPKLLLGSLGALTVLVLAEALNPSLLNWGVALIGTKVWLFYLPLLILGYFWIQSRPELSRLFRWMIILSWIPTTVALVQYVGSHWVGHERFMRFFYGAAAEGATELFVSFPLGGGTMFRIPSTFTFCTQYLNYLLTMIPACYTLLETETASGWKHFARWTFYWIIFSTYLTGERGAFLFVPLMVLALSLMNKNRIKGILRVLGSVLLMVLALKFSGAVLFTKAALQRNALMRIQPDISAEHSSVNMRSWCRMMEHGFIIDWIPNTYAGIVLSIHDAPLGLGTGMNTGAARYAVGAGVSFHGYENYYAKAFNELGILGGMIVIVLFSSLLVQGFRIFQSLEDSFSRTAASGLWTLLALFVIYNLKAWQIDLDPLNAYFWLFAAMLFRLPYLT